MKAKPLFRPARPAMWVVCAVLVTTVFGVRPAHAEAGFNNPAGVAVDRQGNLYVADTGNSRIVKLSSSGRVIAAWDTNADYGSDSSPSAVAVDRLGNVYVTDAQQNRILKYSSGGHLLAQWGSSGDGEFSSPQGIAVGGRGNVFVANTDHKAIEKLSPGGYIMDVWSSLTSDGQNPLAPISIALDQAGNIYTATVGSSPDCACGDSYFIQKRTSNGELLDEWSGFADLGGVAIGGRGNVFVTEPSVGRIVKLSPDGQELAGWGSYGVGPGQFQDPAGIAIGGRGNVFVADTGNNRIVKLSSTGRVMAIWS